MPDSAGGGRRWDDDMGKRSDGEWMRTEDGVANSVVLSVDVKEFVMVVDRSGEGGGWCKHTHEAEAERWRHDELGFFFRFSFLGLLFWFTLKPILIYFYM